MSRIKMHLLSFYARRATRRRAVTRTSVGFDQAQSLGILYSGDSAEKLEVIHQLTARLNRLGKQVTACCYLPDSCSSAASRASITTPRDFRLWGAITHLPTKIFVHTSFDYLYHVDWEGDPVLDYLLARSHAKCRVGHYDSRRVALFEVMVRCRKESGHEELAALASQMLHYTQCLKTS